jgi:hypothetical protein
MSLQHGLGSPGWAASSDHLAHWTWCTHVQLRVCGHRNSVQASSVVLLQGQLVKLRVMSNARAETLRHAQQAELHVEFEEAVRQWQQRSQGHSTRARPSASRQAAQPGADAGAAGAEQEGRSSQAGGAGAESGGGGDSAGYQHRSRKFVNDSPVRERVSSQLAGLRRRASIRQEFEGEL